MTEGGMMEGGREGGSEDGRKDGRVGVGQKCSTYLGVDTLQSKPHWR